jgi:hypothetical protein
VDADNQVTKFAEANLKVIPIDDGKQQLFETVITGKEIYSSVDGIFELMDPASKIVSTPGQESSKL